MAKTRLLLDQVTALERYEAVVPEKDAVHEMRVAARRLRATLRLLRLEKLDPKVKALQDALGEVRDLQLQIVLVRPEPGHIRCWRVQFKDRRCHLIALRDSVLH